MAGTTIVNFDLIMENWRIKTLIKPINKMTILIFKAKLHLFTMQAIIDELNFKAGFKDYLIKYFLNLAMLI